MTEKSLLCDASIGEEVELSFRRLRKTLFPLAGIVAPFLSNAAILPIGQMNITGGTVDPRGDGSFVLAFQTFGPDTNLVGGYIGNGGAGRPPTTPDPDSIVGLQTSSLWLNVYTAPANIGDDNTLSGTLAGGPVPSGTLDTVAGTISSVGYEKNQRRQK
jgi:hypothetical protein